MLHSNGMACCVAVGGRAFSSTPKGIGRVGFERVWMLFRNGVAAPASPSQHQPAFSHPKNSFIIQKSVSHTHTQIDKQRQIQTRKEADTQTEREAEIQTDGHTQPD